jgi:hypothetical protein
LVFAPGQNVGVVVAYGTPSIARNAMISRLIGSMIFVIRQRSFASSPLKASIVPT